MHQPTTAITALVVSLTGLAPAEASTPASHLPVRIVHVSGRGGIDWGDAGIGAAAGAGITLLGLGAALTISQRHAHLTAGPRRPGADRRSPPRAVRPTHRRRKTP